MSQDMHMAGGLQQHVTWRPRGRHNSVHQGWHRRATSIIERLRNFDAPIFLMVPCSWEMIHGAIAPARLAQVLTALVIALTLLLSFAT